MYSTKITNKTYFDHVQCTDMLIYSNKFGSSVFCFLGRSFIDVSTTIKEIPSDFSAGLGRSHICWHKEAISWQWYIPMYQKNPQTAYCYQNK